MRLVDSISKTKQPNNQKLNFEHKNGIFEETRKRNIERAKVVRGEQDRRRKE
jgi:hypothetical protein